jgi:hypothetical protein
MTQVIHTFEDGWKIVNLKDSEELKRENEVVHNGRACLQNGGWLKKLEKETMLLMSLRDTEDNPRATLLFGDADFILESRAGTGYEPYAGCKVYDQRPRTIWKGKSVISLQCCPPGYIGGDVREATEESRRVKEWYEGLPKSSAFRGWDVEAPSRIGAQEFLKKRKEKNPA